MDIEGTMEFILDQQARTSGILEVLAERQSKTEQIVLELGQTMLQVASAQQHASEILAKSPPKKP